MPARKRVLNLQQIKEPTHGQLITTLRALIWYGSIYNMRGDMAMTDKYKEVIADLRKHLPEDQ